MLPNINKAFLKVVWLSYKILYTKKIKIKIITFICIERKTLLIKYTFFACVYTHAVLGWYVKKWHAKWEKRVKHMLDTLKSGKTSM